MKNGSKTSRRWSAISAAAAAASLLVTAALAMPGPAALGQTIPTTVPSGTSGTVTVTLVSSGTPDQGPEVGFQMTCWGDTDPYDSVGAVELTRGDFGIPSTGGSFQIERGAAWNQIPEAATICEVVTTSGPVERVAPATATQVLHPSGNTFLFTITHYGAPSAIVVTNPRGSVDGAPMLYFGDPIGFTVSGCANGTGSATLVGTWGGNQATTLTEVPAGSGTYRGEFPYTEYTGTHTITTTITCPDGSTETETGPVYIDPSGTVVDTQDRPLSGAVVTLLRADTCEGPFIPVADGSDVMSEANRRNPVLTNGTGQFAWDVVAGCYRADASREGCTNPQTGGRIVSTDPLPVPPEWTGLRLVLDCPSTGPAPGTALPALPILAPTDPGSTTPGTTEPADPTDPDGTETTPSTPGQEEQGTGDVPGSAGDGAGAPVRGPVAAAGALVRTGWNARLPIAVGMVLIAAGVGLTVATRNRRSAHSL